MIVGTRGSRLAILQTEQVCERLRARGFGDLLTMRTVSSLGDMMTDKPLHAMPTEGVFVKKLDTLLLAGEIDLAVHSMKDIPLERDELLELSAVLPRDSPFDILVSRYRLDDLPNGAVIGTSSVRRRYQFLHFTQERGIEVVMKDIRGNVDTRLQKLRRGHYDGVILSEAGVERLGMDIEYERLDRYPFVPSPGQGIIAVVARKGSTESTILREIDDADTRVEAELEREVLQATGGGCSRPIGVHASCRGNEVDLSVYIGSSADRYILQTAVLRKDRCFEEVQEFVSGVSKKTEGVSIS